MSKKLMLERLITAVAFASAGWFACQALGPKGKERKTVSQTNPTVAACTARRIAFNPATEYVGHVEPIQETDILPQIDGYIKKVLFTEGGYVKEGDILFEIDPEQYEASRNLRYSEISNAEAKVTVARSEVDRAERYFKRLEAADDRGITGTELDTAETTLASAKAALNASLAAVAQAKAAAAIADFNMKHTAVRAPISGRIGKALHHVGDYVSPSKSALAHVVQTDPIRVVFPVTDKEYGAWRAVAENRDGGAKSSRRLRLLLADGSLYGQDGEIDFGDNKSDRETATVILYARFANAASALLPDAFVRVLSDERKPPMLLALPTGAVERTAKGTHVWKLLADGTVKSVAVETGKAWNGMIAVTGGIADGEKVVALGGFKLRNGMKVSVAK